jgi:YggT family protein
LPKSSLASYSFIHGLGEGLILVLSLFPGFFSLIVIVGALLSWVNPDPYNPIVQVIYGISEPLLAPFRKIVPTLGGLDISPILAILCFQIIGQIGQQAVARLIGMI